MLSDKWICELLRRELEGNDEDCKHGSCLEQHYFLSDLLLFLHRNIVLQIHIRHFPCLKIVLILLLCVNYT